MGIVIDTAIGLALVFFLVSLLASAVQEALANALNSRGKMLELAVGQLLNGELLEPGGFWGWMKDTFRVSTRIAADNSPHRDTLAGQVLGHGLLDSLFKGDRLPTYVPADKFADALIDSLRRRAGEMVPTADGLLWAVYRLPPSQSMYALETLIISSANDITQIRKQFMDWYNASMDRVSGWYSRAVRYRTFVIGLLLAAAFQIDAVRIAQELAHNSTLRSSVVAAATAQVRDKDGASRPTPEFSQTMKELNSFGLPIGWSWCSVARDSNGKCYDETDARGRHLQLATMALMIVGWLVVALAVSQGAPFWFDLISRLVAVRGGGPRPEDPGPKAPPVVVTSAPVLVAPAPAPWTAGSGAPSQLPGGMTADDLRNVQTKLHVPLTAVLDAATRDAIRAFQMSRGEPPSGMLSVALAKRILAS